MDLLAEPFGDSTFEWTALPLRLALGFIFVDAGWGKFSRGIGGTGEWLGGMGFPQPQITARLIASLELVGGMLLLVGLFTHWVAIPLAANMAVATYTQKFKLGTPFQGGEVQGYELDVLMVAACVALILAGAGPLSLDQLLLDAFRD